MTKVLPRPSDWPFPAICSSGSIRKIMRVLVAPQRCFGGVFNLDERAAVTTSP